MARARPGRRRYDWAVPAPVRIAALGGLGEIGMNCMAVECDGRIALVDCGVLFPNENIGVDVIAPDLAWVRERAAQVGAIYVTHGHEDHIGALPLLLAQVKAPVYAPPFAVHLIRARLAEAGVEADVREVRPGDVRGAGDASPISAEYVAVTHSIPDACALAIETPQGVLVHSGDFKIDESPVDGRGFDAARFEALGRAGVRLLLSDSTNAERPGLSLSESQVGPALEAAMERAEGRVFVACFASNVHRVQQIVNAARAFGRRVALLGRAMENNVRLARDLGYLRFASWQLVGVEEARTLPRKELCVVTTGTQGEPRSALSRLARGEHPDLKLDPGDLVILSSRYIPGNEIAVGNVVNALSRQGAVVAYEEVRPLHVSGHAQEEEQRRLMRLVRPAAFVPIHGEYRHLARHAAHAASEGIATRHLVTDGEVLEVGDGGVHLLEDRLPVGRVYLDRDAAGGALIEELVVRDRRLLAETGLVVAILMVDRATGAVVRGPELFGRGVPGLEGAEAEIRGDALRAVEELTPQARANVGEVQEALRLAVRRWFRKEGAKKPSVLPVVLEL
jgi:ribonuclease J